MIPTTMSLRPMTTLHSFMTQVDNSTIRIDVARRDMTITTFLFSFFFFFFLFLFLILFLLRMNAERTSTEFRKTPNLGVGEWHVDHQSLFIISFVILGSALGARHIRLNTRFRAGARKRWLGL